MQDNKESRDIWVLTEHGDGEWHDVTLELLGEARQLAGKLGGKVVAVLLWPRVAAGAEALGKYGADKIYCLEHPLFESYDTEVYTAALHRLIAEEKPNLLLMGATSQGRDLAPRLAARLRTGLVCECVDIRVNRQGTVEVTRPIYGGMVYSTWVCSGKPTCIITMRPGIIGKDKPAASSAAEVIRIQPHLDANLARTKVTGFIPAEPRTMDISEAEVLVACGRGLGSGEKLVLLRALADLLEAAVAGSRPTVDNGWLPPERQIGLTGKTVSARLLVGCGISGSTQFAAGMKDCQFTIAVNTDPAAPIFRLADVGIRCDMHQLLSELVSYLKEARASGNGASKL